MNPATWKPGETRLRIRLRYEDTYSMEEPQQYKFDFAVAREGYALATFAKAIDNMIVCHCDLGPHNNVPNWQAVIPLYDVLEVMQ